MNDLFPKQSRRVTIALALLTVLLIIGGFYAYIRFVTGAREKSPAIPSPAEPAITKDAEGFPVIEVERYTKAYSPPASEPAFLRRYRFGLPDEKSAEQIARRLNVRGESIRDSDFIAFSNDDPDNTSLFVVDTATGRMLYTATRGFKLPALASRQEEELRRLGILDETMVRTASYKKYSEPGIVFTEYRLNPSYTGLPVFHAAGLLNLQENERLADISYASPSATLPPDPDIYESSDASDGRIRPADFNTVTIGVSEEGYLVMVDSNYRRIVWASEDIPVLSNEEALEQLESGNTLLFATLPSGTGSPDPAKVYPGNTGRIGNARIDESLLAYEQSPGFVPQETMEPVWIFRGTGELESGYRVKFVATVAALSPSAGEAAREINLPLPATREVFANDRALLAQQQQGTLTSPDPEPPTPLPTDPFAPAEPTRSPRTQQSAIPSPTPTRAENRPTTVNQRDRGYELPFQGCNPPASELLGTFSVLGYTFGYYENRNDNNPVDGGVQWYMIADNLPPRDTLLSWVSDIVGAIRGRVGNLRPPERIAEDLRGFISAGDRAKGCPVRLTGFSPSVFLYGNTGDSYTVRPELPLTYAEPAPAINGWTVTLVQGALKGTGWQREYLYYEYLPVDMKMPEYGWTIQRADIAKFSEQIGKKLGLTEPETGRLLFELTHAIAGKSEDIISIGLISPETLDSLIPLSIEPRPDRIYRFHFAVSTGKYYSEKQTPQLSPVVRDGSVLLEIGGIPVQE
ncbi:MAG: hypothetical protein N2691_00030 [Patescibacteria group bacterium]|nr:hypothetical protein [Patescibacteria group bacterium]